MTILIHFFYSCKVYAIAKLWLFRMFFYLSSRLAKFSDNGAGVRLLGTDTDSLHLGLEKIRSNCETEELKYLLQTGTNIDYHDTIHAKRFATAYLKSLYRVLDYSSINEKSIVFQTLFAIKDHHSDEEKQEREGMQANLKFLSMVTHKSPFLLTDENGNQLMRFFMSPSPKVHDLIYIK